MHSLPTHPELAAPVTHTCGGTDPATSTGGAGVVPSGEPASDGSHNRDHGLPELNLRVRAERQQHRIDAGEHLSDDELTQHREDCRFLLETAHHRFMASVRPASESPDYAEAQMWMRRRDAAHRALSQQAQDARHAQIDAAVFKDTGVGYFMDVGERDRAALASNEGKCR